VTAETALAAAEAVVARGGDADDVLRDVLAALHEHGIAHAAIRFVEEGRLVDGPAVGADPDGGAVTVPVLYRGDRVGELTLAGDEALAEQVATLIAPYVLVGWDTSGEPWSP